MQGSPLSYLAKNMPGFYGAIVAVLFPARNQWHGCEEWPSSFKLCLVAKNNRFYRPSLNIRMRHGNEASMQFRGIHRMSAIHRVEINLASQS
ncbi:hypothetical protein D5086_027171 [Populus alba]|uniref:Uncharacterized protein n=2 Tax=Populus TaxID=3689 RepID=A0ACC4B3Y3_POPAL|nr:hypothetical protein NC653_033991 [Populus alba x Populus x berolinensis]